MRIVGFDTETCLIEEGLKAPPLVCYVIADERSADLYRWDDRAPLFRLVTEAAEGRTILVGQNIAYDVGVVMAQYPETIPLWFEAYDKGMIRDTRLREQLINLGTVGRPGKASLDDLSRFYLGRNLDKGDDGWRLRYSELRFLPIIDWPERAKAYAGDDGIATRSIYFHQENRGAALRIPLDDEPAQCRAHLALHLMATWGIRTDQTYAAEVEAQLNQHQAERIATLVQAGIMREKKTRKGEVKRSIDTKALAGWLDTWCGYKDTTASGRPSLAYEKLERFADEGSPDYDEIVATYLGHKDDQKTINTYLAKYRSGLVQCSVTPIVGNGRAAVSKPSLQNLPTVGPVRECFVPRDGKLFASVDYDGIEMRTDAQVQFWRYGEKSALARAFQKDPNVDLHSLFAATQMGTTYADIMARKKTDPSVKKARDGAKAPNFGFAGGMGIDRFIASCYQKAAKLRKQGFTPPPVPSREEAERQKEIYLATYPEKVWYFKDMALEDRGSDRMTHYVSGRVRGSVGYCDRANGYFSGLMCDGAKAAGYALVKAMYLPGHNSTLYGSRLVCYIHDEYLAEVDEAGAHEQSHEIARIMCDTMRNGYTPDIPITAAPALMRRWYKTAEGVYNKEGRLIPWEPKTKKQ